MNKRNKILVGCLALLLVLSVGYALFSETITINGTATAKGNFDIGVTCQKGLANVAGLEDNAFNALDGLETENSYSNDSCSANGNSISFTTSLNAPGAMRYYTVKATNNGTITAWAPVVGTSTTQACMSNEMADSVDVDRGMCKKNLFNHADYVDASGNSNGSYRFEDFSFAYIIEKKDGTLVDLYQIPEEEAMSYLSEDGEQIILEPGYSIYYVGKMYISSDYKYSTAYANIMDFNLSADYTLNFVQQTN